MSAVLTFEPVTFNVVDRNGQQWLTLADVARALYGIAQGGDSSVPAFENAERATLRVFKRHAQEFTDRMTALAELHTAGGKQHVRIFSLRGAHLLGMLARTPRAAAFRRWVLDVLEAQTRIPGDLMARLQAAERAEAQSFAAASRGSLSMLQRKNEKRRLLAAVAQAREAIQMSLLLEGGAA